jgi:hypothetical protein
MASGHTDDSWLQQCVLLFRERHDREFKFLACHTFLKNQVRFVNGFDGAACGRDGNGAESTGIACDQAQNEPVPRPALGVKASKKVKLQADVVTEVASRLGITAPGETPPINSPQPALAQISDTLGRMADATIGIYQMWTMQCMVGNDALAPEMRNIVEAALVEQQLAVLAKTSPAVINALGRNDNSRAVNVGATGANVSDGNSDKDGYTFLTQPGVSILQSAIDVASELSGATYEDEVDGNNNTSDDGVVEYKCL